MRRPGEQYDKMAQLAIEIYIDYDIRTFPINIGEVCKKLGVALIPYSEYPPNELEILRRRSKSGFYVPPTAESPPMIFYNNDVKDVGSYGNMRRNVMHEVKHYVCGDTVELPEDDDLADYFGKYFLAPIPYLIYKGISNPNQIISDFCIDMDMAGFIAKNVRNRKQWYNNQIFPYEKPLLQHLLGEDYKEVV